MSDIINSVYQLKYHIYQNFAISLRNFVNIPMNFYYKKKS